MKRMNTDSEGTKHQLDMKGLQARKTIAQGKRSNASAALGEAINAKPK